MTDNERVLRMVVGQDQPFFNEYPSQDDPLYWSKVPAVFEKVFANPEALQTFKATWATHRVPLYAMWKDEKQLKHNMGFVSNLYEQIARCDEKSQALYHELLQERRRGHNEESFYLSQGTLTVDGKLYTNVGLMRALKLHNLLSYQTTMDKNIADYDVIVEIGGGVGELCTVARGLGFEGDYWGIDFKPMCDISAYNNGNHPKNFYIQNVKDLPVFEYGTKVLVIGTWSFSEMDLLLREPVVARLAKADWLIGFQRSVFGMDNLSYFVNDFLDYIKPSEKKLIPLEWLIWNGGNFYLFCKQD